eukprot:gnl/Hemi2/20192_TR6695_c0_g1_i1.p1 gnl/Hemi2/20192_TR6695_c0_g1~~gnl/Hemi2/20192_TR6695_c0_g1_i1.p1  ORF type:complete len:376 (+),score=83.16 gnl/Hemi2/20192_TR6695_c0_g1_i1:162-1289(+)
MNGELAHEFDFYGIPPPRALLAESAHPRIITGHADGCVQVWRDPSSASDTPAPASANCGTSSLLAATLRRPGRARLSCDKNVLMARRVSDACAVSVGLLDGARCRVWDLPSAACVAACPLAKPAYSATLLWPRAQQQCQQGRPSHLAAGFLSGHVGVWRWSDATHTHGGDATPRLEAAPAVELHGHVGNVHALTCLPAPAGDTPWVASGGGDSTVKVWNVTTAACLASLSAFTSSVCGVAADSNSHLASFSGSRRRDVRELRLWDLQAGAACWELETGPTELYGGHNPVAVAGNIVAALAFPHVAVWDVRTGAAVLRLTGGRSCSCVIFGRPNTVLTSRSDGAVLEWDIRSVPVCLHSLVADQHRSVVTCLAVEL